MTDEKPIWHQAFPYAGGDVLVTRSPRTWRVSLGAQDAEATTLVDAFEALIRKRAGAAELKVVVAALAWDRDFGSKETPTGMPDLSIAATQPVEEADEEAP
jgi:hypothetical protein